MSREREKATRWARTTMDSLSPRERWDLGDVFVLGGDASDAFDGPPPPGGLGKLARLIELWEQSS